jgi:hypothetical protein
VERKKDVVRLQRMPMKVIVAVRKVDDRILTLGKYIFQFLFVTVAT